VNWQKTKVQSLESSLYLDSLVQSTTHSSTDISRRNAISRAAMQNLDNQMWKKLEVKNLHLNQAGGV